MSWTWSPLTETILGRLASIMATSTSASLGTRRFFFFLEHA